MHRTFKNWLVSEGKDIFGFENTRAIAPSKKADEGPVVPISADIIMEYMMCMVIDGQESFSNYHDHVQWGRYPGAVQMVISPLGSFKSIIRKLSTDLLGESVWVCKEIIPYKNMLHASERLDENIAEDVFEKIEEHWKGELETPSREYKGLERLTLRVAEASRRKGIMPEIFVFRGVRMVEKDRHYNIHFELSGQGVEAPGSARVEQFSIEMAYDKESGMVRSFGHDIQSSIKGHQWYPQPSEWDEKFCPSQKDAEIVSAICAALSTY
jgi:hypothetical protein